MLICLKLHKKSVACVKRCELKNGISFYMIKFIDTDLRNMTE
jgi:hypothetical protein